MEDLRDKTLGVTIENSRIVLQIDNARPPACLQITSEPSLRWSRLCEGAWRQTSGPAQGANELTPARADLETHIQGLQEELDHLEKNHNEDISAVGGQVSVEVDSAPGVGLAKILGNT